MNSITIMVPTLATILQLSGGLIILLIVRKGVREVREWRQIVREGVREADKAEDRSQAQLSALLPSPWNEAYVELERIHDGPSADANPKSRNFLRHWLLEQKNLPRLSREAVYEIACLLTFEYCDKWDDCLAIFSPYSNVKSLAETEKLARKERERLATEKKLAERKDMFPYPWDTAYEACEKTQTWGGAQLWLKRWMGEQQDLPQISVIAVEELLSKVVESKDKEGYSVFNALIAPHLDTGYAPHRDVSEYNLKAKLPGEWFKFWQEIKDYPARRSLFLENLAKYSSGQPHPVFQVPLTIDQAALLSRALGGDCENKTGLYASDLIGCVERKKMATVTQ